MTKCFKYDAVYLRSFLAIIKLIQIVFLLIAWAAIQSFINLTPFTYTKFSKLQFFVLVTAIGWITYLVTFCLNFLMITNHLPIPWYWVYLIMDVIFALFLSIAVVVIAIQIDVINNAERIYTPELGVGQKIVGECEFIKLNSGSTCSTLDAGVVFGSLGICLIIVEIIVCIRKLRKGEISHYNSAFIHDDVTVSTTDTITSLSLPSRYLNQRSDVQEYQTEGMF